MKVFVSLGFKDRSSDDILKDLAAVQYQLTQHFKTTDVEMVHNYFCEKPEDGPRLYCLGEAIKLLSECDYCCMVKGWDKFNGCYVEKMVCDLYNIPVIYLDGNQ